MVWALLLLPAGAAAGSAPCKPLPCPAHKGGTFCPNVKTPHQCDHAPAPCPPGPCPAPSPHPAPGPAPGARTPDATVSVQLPADPVHVNPLIMGCHSVHRPTPTQPFPC